MCVRAAGTGGCLSKVQDYGPGIDPEQRIRIFQPSYQEARQFGELAGMGIGLELCKVLVEQHGGRIGLVTRRGKGCTFTVELPISPSARQRQSELLRTRWSGWRLSPRRGRPPAGRPDGRAG